MRISTQEVKLRSRGHNAGIPMLHCSLSSGSGPSTKELVTQIVYGVLGGDQKSNWVCLETTNEGVPVGIGSLISGLISCGVEIDLHIHNPKLNGSSSSTPSWITKPKNVVVDYCKNSSLNYHGLTKDDVILFEDPTGDLSEAFKFLEFMPPTKWIFSNNEEEYFSLVQEHQRSRLSWVS